MARFYATRFRRRMVAGFAGDAVPAGAQTLNDPTAGTGVLLRLPPRRPRDPASATKRVEGYLLHGGGLAVTWTLQLYEADGLGTAPAAWIKVGDPLVGVPASRKFRTAGVTLDADVVIQCTPSAPLAGAETADLCLCESE